MKKLVIYHGGCQDGFGAAYSIWRWLGDNADYVPAAYGLEPPDVTAREVIIVDFSYKFDVMVELSKKATRVLVLDHHKTARDDLKKLEDLKLPNVTLSFDMDRSGAMMAFNFAFPLLVPLKVIQHINDRDLWKFNLSDTRAVCAALASYPHDFKVWHEIAEKLEDDERFRRDFIIEGQAIDRQHRAHVEGLKKNATIQEIGGYRVPVCNANYHLASDLANALAHGHPFAATYFDRPDARIYSLRSTKDGVDVNTIAEGYGGGGHKHAAGFQIEHRTPPGAVPYQVIACPST